ncbi:GumC family protein [Methylocapsa palsarum]|uniref:Uncharacterized protein involved in exopolysaccharide biosynthesis n=1 Tax=Methylocapsa palsarum TaxID=1612308 RepID=A0A1I4A6Z8_9HYPH|nr:hypothetical protein [Methylocapsa palsarum]SFK51626.1 Uncharacterized protein involved in exopolysaccharide biosynthesis [Methylocapsa palsarum]
MSDLIRRQDVASYTQAAARAGRQQDMVDSSFLRPEASLLRWILDGFVKSWRRILLAMAATLGLTLAIILLIKPTFVANATLLVLLSSEYSPRAAGDDAKSAAIVLERDAVLKNEVEILTSPTLEKETLRKVGLERVYPDFLKPPGLLARFSRFLSAIPGDVGAFFGSSAAPPRVIEPLDIAAQKFAKDLTAAPDKAGNIIVVSFRNSDPVVAAEVVNEQISAYLAKRQELLRDTQTKALSGQAEALRAELDQAGRDYAEFKAKNNISDYGTQRQFLLREKSNTSQDLQQADRSLAQATQRLAVLQQEFDKLPKDVVQYRNVQRVLPRARTVVLDTLEVDRSRVQQELEAAKARHGADVSQLAKLDDELKSLEEKEFELERLDRKRKLVDENFRSVVKALDDRALQEDVIAKKTANVRVIQEAETPVAPTNVRLVVFAAGILLTCFAGFLATILSNVFRRGYLSQEAVEHDLGLPVLVSLPLLSSPPQPITPPDAAKP